MTYKIIVSLRAQQEVENAIDYYALYSLDAPKNFIKILQEAYFTLGTNPFFSIKYKNIRAFKLKKFPYSIYFIINESDHKVRILS